MSLCSFGNSQKLTNCNLFEKVAFAFGKEKCFTFNGSTSSSEHHQRKVGPNNGLNFLVSFRIPSQRQKGPKMQKNLTPLKLIVHEPGTFPDVHHTTNSYHEIKPGYHYIFGTESTMKGAALLPNIPEYNLPPMNRNSGTTKAPMGQEAWLGGFNVFVSRHLPTLGVGLVLAITVASRGPTTHFGSAIVIKHKSSCTQLARADRFLAPTVVRCNDGDDGRRKVFR